jgi:hypothetical protein
MTTVSVLTTWLIRGINLTLALLTEHVRKLDNSRPRRGVERAVHLDQRLGAREDLNRDLQRIVWGRMFICPYGCGHVDFAHRAAEVGQERLGGCDSSRRYRWSRPLENGDAGAYASFGRPARRRLCSISTSAASVG